MTSWAEAWEQLNNADTGNATCDGLYCGGPFFESVAGLVVIMAAIVGVVGLVISAVQFKRQFKRGGKGG